MNARRAIALVLTLTMPSVMLAAQPIPDVEAEETPLHWAAANGLTRIAELLIGNGADVSAPDAFGRTPLHRAVQSPEVVALLLRSGASVNAQDVFGRTPLHLALPYPESVVLLIDSGADLDARDFLGNTPLDRATAYGTGSANLRTVELLVLAGAGAPPRN